MIDLLAHYDAVAELMAAMGGRLENQAGSFTGLAVSYSRKFTNEKVRLSVYVRDGGELPVVGAGVKCDQQQTSGGTGLCHVLLTSSLKKPRFMGACIPQATQNSREPLNLTTTAFITMPGAKMLPPLLCQTRRQASKPCVFSLMRTRSRTYIPRVHMPHCAEDLLTHPFLAARSGR